MYRVDASIGQTTELSGSRLYTSQACAFITAQSVYSAINHPVTNITPDVLDQWINLGVDACKQYKISRGESRLARVSPDMAFQLYGLEASGLMLPPVGGTAALDMGIVEETDDTTISEMAQALQPIQPEGVSAAGSGGFPTLAPEASLSLEKASTGLLKELLMEGKWLALADSAWPRNYALSIGFLKAQQTLIRKLFTEHPGSPGHVCAILPMGPSPSCGWCFFNSKGEPGAFRGYARCVDSRAEVSALVDHIVNREMLNQSSLFARVRVWKRGCRTDIEKEYDVIETIKSPKIYSPDKPEFEESREEPGPEDMG